MDMEALSGTSLYGSRGQRIVLTDYIHKGGEGAVYHIRGSASSVVKLFNPDAAHFNEALMRQKLSVMLRHPPQYHGEKPCCAWPTDIVNYENGRLAGYVMPCIQAVGNVKSATRTSEIIRTFPNYTWKTGITIAKNLATAFRCMHENHIVIGDSNFSNMLILEDLRVMLIDTDSFTITDPDTGAVFKTRVTRPDYVPPELIDKNWGSEDTLFTVASDRFTLSSHILSLLCNNTEPFSCIQAPPMPAIKGDSFDNIRGGRCAYVTRHNPLLLPQPCAPDMAMLPQNIRTLFDRTFTYDMTNAQTPAVINGRPSADEWVQALTALENSRFIRCSKNRRHLYVLPLKGDTACPWCALENGSSYRRLTGRLPVRLPVETPYNASDPDRPQQPPKPSQPSKVSKPTGKAAKPSAGFRILVTLLNIYLCADLALSFSPGYFRSYRLIFLLIGILTPIFVTLRTTRDHRRILWPMLLSLFTTLILTLIACLLFYWAGI